MSRSMKIVAWVANLLVPGVGLILANGILAGTLGAVAWGVATVGALVGIVWPSLVWPPMRMGMVAFAIMLYVWMQVLLGLAMWKARVRLADTGRDEEFKKVLVAYLQGRYDEAETGCKALLRQDPADVEATLQLGSIARRRGRLAVARRWFRRARYLDDRGTWDSEIDRELAALGTMAAQGAGQRGRSLGR